MISPSWVGGAMAAWCDAMPIWQGGHLQWVTSPCSFHILHFNNGVECGMNMADGQLLLNGLAAVAICDLYRLCWRRMHSATAAGYIDQIDICYICTSLHLLHYIFATLKDRIEKLID